MIPNDRSFGGKEIVEAEGKVFCRSYKIQHQGKFRIVFRIVEVNSPYRQGVAFSLSNSPAFKGKIWINGNTGPLIRESEYPM